MKPRTFAVIAASSAILLCAATLAFSKSVSPQALPGWFLQPSGPHIDGGGTVVDPDGQAHFVMPAPDEKLAACQSDAVRLCSGKVAFETRTCLSQKIEKLSGQCKVALDTELQAGIAASGGVPACSHSPLCRNRLGRVNQDLQRVEWRQTLGYTFAYPFALPLGGGGVSGVGIDPHGNFWVLQRTAPGKPQLFKFDKTYKLLLSVGDDVIGHLYKAHGIKVDADGNVWICDANGPTVMKLSPQGKLLMTIGVKGQRGDWNEAGGQRLLWQPQDIAFGKTGDIYIAEGHGNESPNDTDLSPTNNMGVARVIHLDRNGKFINQWYGNDTGQGKFTMAHAIAVDPRNGDVWIGDREQYRLVVYSAAGDFLRTIQLRNLSCALYFDPHGQLWMASGQDGQILKLDWSGTVLGAIGNGSGRGNGQFIESNYMSMDAQGNLYSGDTSIGRVTEMVAPK